jgi:putative membrane protein
MRVLAGCTPEAAAAGRFQLGPAAGRDSVKDQQRAHPFRRGHVMRKTVFALGLLALSGATLPTVLPASKPLAQATGATALGGPDTTFLPEAIRSGLAEVELGKLGAQKASNAQVKQFAERMVVDHSAANDKLAALAAKHKIEPEGTKGTPPLEPDEQAAAKMREISGLSGAAFDQAFMRQMTEDHEKAIELFDREAKEGEDAEVRGLAAEALPKLREHLAMARRIGPQVGVSG